MIPFSEHDIPFGPKDCLLWKPGMQTSPHACSLAWVILPDLPRLWLAVGWPLSWQSPLRQPCACTVWVLLEQLKLLVLALLQTHLHRLWTKDNAFLTNLPTCSSGEKHRARLGNAGSVPVNRTPSRHCDVQGNGAEDGPGHCLQARSWLHGSQEHCKLSEERGNI